MNVSRNRACLGFTLVEMVAAVVILGILSGLLLVTVGSARDKTLQTRIQADMEMINLAKGSWQLDNVGQTFPSSETDRFNAIKAYFSISKTFSTLADLQPPGVTYTINALGVSAASSP